MCMIGSFLKRKMELPAMANNAKSVLFLLHFPLYLLHCKCLNWMLHIVFFNTYILVFLTCGTATEVEASSGRSLMSFDTLSEAFMQ